MAYIGVQPTAGQYRKLDNISSGFNGSSTSFTTSVGGTNVTAGTAQQLIVSLGGVIQQPDTDYTVSTSTITFTTAPAAGLDFFAILMGDALNTVTPSDGSVTTAKLAGSLSVGLAAGTVSAPSLFFTGDSNNGIYSPGADQLAVTTNGTQRLIVDSTGQIEAKSLGTAAAPVWTFVDDPNTGFWSPTADTLAASTNGTERLRITSAGNVGIGATPSAKLHVNTGTNENLWVGSLGGSGAGVYLASVNDSGSANTPMQIGSASTINFAINGSDAAKIDSSRRLLVGTPTGRNIADAAQGGIQYETTNFGGISLTNNRGDASGATLAFGKQRSGSVGGNTIVQNGDALGAILFGGADGTDLETPGASITCNVDGTPGANDMPGRLVFSTTADGASSPTERMRINNIGDTYIYSNDYPLTVATNRGAGTTYQLITGRHSATGNLTGTDSFRVHSNGNVQNTNGSYTAISDAKLKENIVDASSQWDDLKAIQIRNWNFKEETGHETHRQIGPIAQELETVCPGLVFETPDRDEDGNETGEVTKGVNQSVLYMKAVKALQEAMERIEQLEAEMAEVKAQLS